MLSDNTDTWVPVALAQDLPSGTVMPARLSTGSIALWRGQSGRISASADRCPHRGMRLSHGFVRGEQLSCIYHGWSYSQAGNCVRIPAHPGLVPPDTIRVVTHVADESGGIVWVADGKPASEPPRFDGFVPLRSLTARTGRAALAAAGAKIATDGLSWEVPGTPVIRLLSVRQDGGETLIHVLVPENVTPDERIAASRAVESLRQMAERIEAKGPVS